MLIGGLWHGANWTFVVWGGIHGGALAIERVLGLGSDEPERAGWLTTWLKRILLFNLVCVTWVFFRAPSIHEAFAFLGGLSHWAWQPEYLTAFKFLALFSVPMFLMDLRLEKWDEEYIFQRASAWLRTGMGFTAMVAIAFFAANQVNAFIYFQF